MVERLVITRVFLGKLPKIFAAQEDFFFKTTPSDRVKFVRCQDIHELYICENNMYISWRFQEPMMLEPCFNFANTLPWIIDFL